MSECERVDGKPAKKVVVKGVAVLLGLLVVWTAYGLISGNGLVGGFGARSNPTIHEHASAQPKNEADVRTYAAALQARVQSACSPSVLERLLFGSRRDHVEIVFTRRVDGTERYARYYCGTGEIHLNR